jgi:hypothetical protein
VEELRMLSNFQAGERALLQSFLIGQPELRPILQGQDMQQFRQRIIASYHLGPLDRTETESYVLHRLKQVGWVGDPRLEHDAFDGIYNFTAGIPRRINMVCNRLLLAGFLNEKHALDGNDVELVAGEIKEELGLTPRNAPGAEVRSAADMQDLQSNRDGSNGRTEARGQRSSAPALRGDDSDRELLQRVARLERTLALVFGMLRRVVEAMEPLEKPFKELRH